MHKILRIHKHWTTLVYLFICLILYLFVCHALLLYVNYISCDYAYACACAHTQITHHITIYLSLFMTIYYCMTVRNDNICVAIVFSYMMIIFTTCIYTCTYFHTSYIPEHALFFVQCPCLLLWTYLYVFAFVLQYIMMSTHANYYFFVWCSCTLLYMYSYVHYSENKSVHFSISDV